MSNDEEPSNPEDELRQMLQKMLNGEIDASELAKAAGLPSDPALLANMMTQLQQVMANSSGTLDWSVAAKQANTVAAGRQLPITDTERQEASAAFDMAALWLSEVTPLTDASAHGRTMNRTEWAEKSMPFWQDLATPVATSITNALVAAIESQAPEELGDVLAGAKQMITGVGGALFAMQLGQVIGQLSTEVLSATEIGVPVLDDPTSALIPQNVVEFSRDISVEADQVRIYLATRELAHTALFKNAKWLPLQLLSTIRQYAEGISIDMDRIEELAAEFNPSDTEQFQEAIRNGALIPPKSPAQVAALERLETLLALIEGWVDVVTERATVRLPKAAAIAEMFNRRRASGSPAEGAFGALVGLELRPRRLREASALWRAIDDAVGSDRRDALWRHPDSLPVAADIDDPGQFALGLTAPAPADDAFDRDLAKLLAGGFEATAPEDPEDAGAGDGTDGTERGEGDAGAGDGDAPEDGKHD